MARFESFPSASSRSISRRFAAGRAGRPTCFPWAFARACAPAAAARSSAAQAALAREAATAWRILLQRCGGAERVSWPGWLKLAEGAGEVADLGCERRRLEAEGHRHAWLDADGVAALEPGLGPRFAAGLRLRGLYF